MQDINTFREDTVINSGTIIRLFGVKRFDTIKLTNDGMSNEKTQKDFFDYMVVDCSAFSDKSLVLINVTIDNPNRGSVLCVFDQIETSQHLDIHRLKKYFSKNQQMHIELNS